MACRDHYGYPLSTGDAAAAAYDRGMMRLLRLDEDATRAIAESIAHDPTFALGHAGLALIGHEMCGDVQVEDRLRDAEKYAVHATERERSHVHAVVSHVRGDSTPLLRHLEEYPRDALLLSTAVPTIAFAGVTDVPEDAWAIVERAAPAYGDDWWFTGLLAFVRQEQGRFEEAMELSCRSLSEEPGAGHSAHARTHAHYETGDHARGLEWIDGWLSGRGASMDSKSHFSWHAALHELSMGDLEAVRRRYESQLRPENAIGCRALVDSGSLLFRWAITPGAIDVPSIEHVAALVGRDTLERPGTPFLAMHSAVILLAIGDAAGLRSLGGWARAHAHPVQREVVEPLTVALLAMHEGRHAAAADALRELAGRTWRLGGSDAQREIIEETRICALLKAGRHDEARTLLDGRIDRHRSPRDRHWLADARRAG